jgi:hypothetical protein
MLFAKTIKDLFRNIRANNSQFGDSVEPKEAKYSHKIKISITLRNLELFIADLRVCALHCVK